MSNQLTKECIININKNKKNRKINNKMERKLMENREEKEDNLMHC